MLQNQINELVTNSDYAGLMSLINAVLEKADKNELGLVKQVKLPQIILNSEELKNEGRLCYAMQFDATHTLNEVPLIAWIVLNGHTHILKKMLELGFDCNDAIPIWQKKQVMITPLMLACLFNETVAVQILLSVNAHLTGYDFHNMNLMKIITVNSNREIIELIFNHTQTTNNIQTILSHTSKRNDSIQTTFAPSDIVESLLIFIFRPDIGSKLKLSDLRLFSPFIHEHFRSQDKVIAVEDSMHLYNSTSSLSFFKNKPETAFVSKEIQIQNALSDYHKLLDDPKTCFRLLQKLEKALKARLIRTLGVENLAEIDSEQYTIETHYISQWPVPTQAFKPLKLYSLLGFAIMAELNNFGFGKESYKWYGFIHDEIASDHIKNGFYPTENTLEIGALLHGKHSHSIQLLILMYAIEANLIRMSYGEGQTLTTHDLLQALVTASSDGNKPWSSINDSVNESFASFSGPHYLHSTLMLKGAEYGLPNLQYGLINSFSKAIIRTMNFHNTNFAGDYSSPKDFWDNLITLISPRKFLLVDITNHFYRAEKNSVRSEEKHYSGALQSHINETYIVSQKFLSKPQIYWNTITECDAFDLSVNKYNANCYQLDLDLTEVSKGNRDKVEALMQEHTKYCASEVGIIRNYKGRILGLILNKQHALTLSEKLTQLLDVTNQNSVTAHSAL